MTDSTVGGLNWAGMQPLSIRLLRLFGELGRETLDLHTLLESVGSDPAQRRLVLDAIEELRRDGLLDERSGDFYVLTEKGRSKVGGGERRG